MGSGCKLAIFQSIKVIFDMVVYEIVGEKNEISNLIRDTILKIRFGKSFYPNLKGKLNIYNKFNNGGP